MEEDLECIICYDQIDKNVGDYILDICDTCKYAVHITCYEKYILINNSLNKTDINANICLMCHKSTIIYNTILTENVNMISDTPIQINRLRYKRLITILSVISIITIIAIIAIIIYNYL